MKRVLYALIFLVFITPVFGKTWIGNCTFSNPLDLVYGEYNNTSYLLCLSNNTSSYYSIKNILGTEEVFIEEANYPAFLYFYPIGNDTIYMPSYSQDTYTANITILKSDFTLDTKISMSFSSIVPDAAGYQNCFFLGGMIFVFEGDPRQGYLYKICQNGAWSVTEDNSFGQVTGLHIDGNYLYMLNSTSTAGGQSTATLTKMNLSSGALQVLASNLCEGGDVYVYDSEIYVICYNGSVYKIQSGEATSIYSFGTDIKLDDASVALDFEGPYAIVGLSTGGIYVLDLPNVNVTEVDNTDTYIAITHNDTNIFALTESGDVYSFSFQFQPCVEGWVCLNSSYSAYRYANCSVTNITYCEWGCEGAVPWSYNASLAGRCIPERPPGYGQYQQGFSDGVCIGSASEDADCCAEQGGFWWNRQCWAEPVVSSVNVVGDCSSHLDCPAGSFCDSGKCVSPTDYIEFRTNTTLWFSSTVPIPQRYSLNIEYVPIDIRPVLNVQWDEGINSIQGYFAYYNGNIYVCDGTVNKLYLFNTTTESLDYVADNCFIIDLDYTFSKVHLNLDLYTIADLDDDGFLDLITVNESANVCVYEENVSHSFELVTCFSHKVNVGVSNPGFSEECGNVVAFENKYIRYVDGSYRIFNWTNVNTGESLPEFTSCVTPECCFSYMNFRCFNNKLYTSAFVGDPASGYAYTTCDLFPECYQEHGMNKCGWEGYAFILDDEIIYTHLSADCLNLYKEESNSPYAQVCPYTSLFFEYDDAILSVERNFLTDRPGWGGETVHYCIITKDSSICRTVAQFESMVISDWYYNYYNQKRVGDYFIDGNYLFKISRPTKFEEPSVTIRYKTYEKTISLPTERTSFYSPMIVDMINEELLHSLFSISFEGESGTYRVSSALAAPLFQGGVSLPPPPPPKCGNGICDLDEDPKTCPIDCLAWFTVTPQTINAYLSKGECKIYTVNLTWQYSKKPESTLIKNPNPKFAIEPKSDQVFVFTKVAPNIYKATVPIKVCIPEHQLLKVELPYYLGTDTIQFKVFSEREYLKEVKVNTYEIRKYDLTWIIIPLLIVVAVMAILSKRRE